MSTSTQHGTTKTVLPLLLAANDVGQEQRVLRLRNDYQFQVVSRSAADLPCDFVWFPHSKKYGIELKDGGDILGSLSDKRIVGQAKKMVETLDFPLILIAARVGHERATGKLILGGSATGWDYRSYKSMMADLMMIGCAVEEWDGDATERIAAWVINTMKEDHAWLQQRTRPQTWALVPSYNNAIWALSAFEGIGPKTAEALLKKYGSVAGVIKAAAAATTSDISKKSRNKFGTGVEGMGAKRAASFVGEITMDYVSQ